MYTRRLLRLDVFPTTAHLNQLMKGLKRLQYPTYRELVYIRSVHKV